MDTTSAGIYVGCAGWSLPAAVQAQFPSGGTHLARYASVFPAVEINTSFYRSHRDATYTRWRDSVPDTFRFAAKVPKAITHEARLNGVDALLEKFVEEVGHLEPKLGCLLVQLPPSLRYDADIARRFFHTLRALTSANIVYEARHATWFTPEAACSLTALGVSAVLADPPVAPLPDAASAAGILYIRLHGSPVVYYSAYPEDYLASLAERIAREARAGRQVWCVFDNTASGAAVPNSLSLLARLRQAEFVPA
ncbi:DUF72 domain-containing protein [Herbaspirillum sp. HC18]|nr:DUF72 domain-containing protein [Herbaspirillum sp. HC18]